MDGQLNSFASEVTRVAREVGTEGKLGGHANVPGVAGTWKDLTDNVNSMAANSTFQVRAIAEVEVEVVTAVTKGDFSRSITVEAKGEVGTLNSSKSQGDHFDVDAVWSTHAYEAMSHNTSPTSTNETSNTTTSATENNAPSAETSLPAFPSASSAVVTGPLSKHLNQQDAQFIQFAFRWMNCLLMCELPLHLVIHMWDTYLAEGPSGGFGSISSLRMRGIPRYVDVE